MKSFLFRFFLLLALALGAGLACAEKADRDRPLNVEADALRYDDQKQTSVFSGRVVLTKGTILIRAARIDVRQDAQGYQFGLINKTEKMRGFQIGLINVITASSLPVFPIFNCVF